MNIGDRVRRARKHAKLTQDKLGKAVGLKQATISDLEKGDSRSSAYLAQIAHVCGVDPYWLATGHGSMEAGPQDGGASPQVEQEAQALAALASPRSEKALEHIAQAARDGRLTEDDLLLLERIAKRIAAQPAAEPTRHNKRHQRLKEALGNHDPPADT